MRNTICFFLFLFLVSCKKDGPVLDDPRINREVSACGVKDPVNNLRWLKSHVRWLKDEGLMNSTTIVIFEFKGETYFHSMIGYSSQMGDVLDCTGKRINGDGLSEEDIEALWKARTADSAVMLLGGI